MHLLIIIYITSSHHVDYDVEQQTSGTHIREGQQLQSILSQLVKPNHTTRAHPRRIARPRNVTRGNLSLLLQMSSERSHCS